MTKDISSLSWKGRRGGKGDLGDLIKHFCVATMCRIMGLKSVTYRSYTHLATALEAVDLPSLVQWVALSLGVNLRILCSFIGSIKYFQFASQCQCSTALPYTLEVILTVNWPWPKKCEHKWHMALLGRNFKYQGVTHRSCFPLLQGRTACSMSLDPRVRMMQSGAHRRASVGI